MLDLAPLPWASHPTSPDWAGNTAALASFEGVEGGRGIINFPPPSRSVLILVSPSTLHPFFEKGQGGGMDQSRRKNCNRSNEI
jgi:hypothetical protein